MCIYSKSFVTLFKIDKIVTKMEETQIKNREYYNIVELPAGNSAGSSKFLPSQCENVQDFTVSRRHPRPHNTRPVFGY